MFDHSCFMHARFWVQMITPSSFSGVKIITVKTNFVYYSPFFIVSTFFPVIFCFGEDFLISAHYLITCLYISMG